MAKDWGNLPKEIQRIDGQNTLKLNLGGHFATPHQKWLKSTFNPPTHQKKLTLFPFVPVNLLQTPWKMHNIVWWIWKMFVDFGKIWVDRKKMNGFFFWEI